MNETKKRILCLGDSNTYGYDPCDALGGRYPREIRWTGRLGLKGLTVFNRGMNGAGVPVQREYGAFSELIASLQPLDAITVMLGTNDILQGRSAEATATRMAAFTDAMRASAGEAKMLLIAPPHLTFGDWVQSAGVITQSEKLDELYEAVAREQGLAFADAQRWEVSLTFDGVHFTPEGHAAFFDGLYQFLHSLNMT